MRQVPNRFDLGTCMGQAGARIRAPRRQRLSGTCLLLFVLFLMQFRSSGLLLHPLYSVSPSSLSWISSLHSLCSFLTLHLPEY